MHDFENHVFDVLRVLEKYEDRSGCTSIDMILRNHFRYYIPSNKADDIHSALKDQNLIFSVEEENGAKINPNGKLLIRQKFTQEYILDRVLDYLYKHPDSWEYLSEILKKMQIELDDQQKRSLEARVAKSGLVDYQKQGYWDSFKIKDDGILALEDYDSFSEYKKHELSQQQPTVVHHKPHHRRSMISFTDQDIANLDNIIRQLNNSPTAVPETVAELLDGWQKFPDAASELELKYKVYEDFLLENNLCADKGIPRHKMLHGYTALKIDSEGRKLLFQNKSVRDFIQEHQEQLAQPITITATFGPNSPIAGRDVKMKDVKVNEPNEEDKKIARKGLHINRKILFWTIAGVIAALVMLLRALRK